MRIQLPTGSLSRRALDRFSIRLRLAIWYAMLVAATLALFSVIVFAVAQYQIENSVDQGLQSNAQIIALTVQGGLAGPPSALPGVSSSATATSAATPSATPSATPAGTATSSPSANGTATPLPTATPVPSIDPSTKKKIQQRLALSGPVKDLLGRLNLTFEVLDANHGVVYSPSNLAASPPALDATSLRATLRTGACMASTRSQRGATWRIYLYPLTQPASGGRATVIVSGPTSCTVAAGTLVVGVVVVAKTVDDVNTTLSTLQRLLFAGVLVALLLASLGAWFIVGGRKRSSSVSRVGSPPTRT